MPRPSELLRAMLDEAAAGKRPDSRQQLGRWLDTLESQTDPTTLRFETSGGGGGAPSTAPYLTVGAAAGLPNARQIAHDTTLTHTDGGAGGAYTLGVVANGHRHIEENIDETHYLVVDAGGRGDYVTIQGAIDAISAVGGAWVVMIRAGVYAESLNFWAGSTHETQVTLIGYGQVTIQVPDAQRAIDRTSYYTTVKVYHVTFTQAIAGAYPFNFIHCGSGNVTEFYDCVLEPGTGTTLPCLYTGNGSIRFVQCTIGKAGRTYAGLVGYPGAAPIVADFIDCLIQGRADPYDLVAAHTGATVTLLHCRIYNTGPGYDLNNGDTLLVGRCLYNTAKVHPGGEPTILDGDIPVRLWTTTGHRQAVAIKSTSYTLTSADEVVVFTATATASLPAATGSGQTYRLVCRAGTLTVDASGSETIKGATTQTLYAGEDVIITDTATGVWE